MSLPRIVVSIEAQDDMISIENYIAEREGPLRASMVMGHIEESIRVLAFMPGMGRPRRYLEKGRRAFSVSPWIVFYVPLPDLDGIRILRVVDGRRDLPAVFGKKKRN